MNSSKALLLLAIAVLLLFSTMLVLPFLQYFLLAVLLAYILTPLQTRLSARMNDSVSAALLVVATTVVLILPFVLVVRATAAEAAALFRAIRSGELTLGVFEEPLEQLTGVDVDLVATLRSAISDGGTEAFGSLLGVFGLVTHTLIGLGLMLFLLYYFLKDGDQLRRWLWRTAPISDEVLDHLYGEIDEVTGAVLAGHVLVALVQGIIAGVGLFVVGIPNALFWTAVMIVLALLPIVGSFIVWGPATFYLFANGRPLAAAFLFVYGAIIVGVSDDYLRPVIVDRYAQVNPSVIIIGVLGGIYAIGFMGIFFGPIIIGGLRATLDVFREEYVTATVD